MTASLDVETRQLDDERGYRSLLQFAPKPQSRDAILGELRTWLEQRGLAPKFDHSDRYSTEDADLLVLVRDVEAGFEFSADLSERNEAGVWTSQVTMRIPRSGDGWCLIDVKNDRGRSPGLPRLARYLLDVEDHHDGAGALRQSPRVIRSADVDEALDIACDPERRGLAFFAGTSAGRDVDRFVDEVAFLTRDTAGLAQVLVLDPIATAEPNTAIGPDHAVPDWSLRTFLPEADPASRVDSRRHKIVGAYRIQEQGRSKTRAMLSFFARTQARSAPLPGAVTKLQRSFVRMSDTLIIETSTARSQPTIIRRAPAPAPRSAPRYVPPSTPETVLAEPQDGEAAAQLELIRDQLELDVISAESLSEVAAMLREARTSAQTLERLKPELEARQLHIEALEDELTATVVRFEDEQLDHAESEDERGRLADANHWLRRRLRELEDYDGASALVPEDALTVYPGSFDQLLERLRDAPLDGVHFTGDPDAALGLDRLDTTGLGVRWAWEALLTLADYRRAKVDGTCQANVHGYLSEPHDLRKVPPKRHVPVESGRTMQQWGDDRAFPVPASVDPTCLVRMEAHFRLHTNDTNAPRMHYLDCTGTDGMIYVGYIGTHLTNTKTARA